MSHKCYTSSQIEELLRHTWVLSCTEKYLRFTPQFKKDVLDLYEKEYISPKDIFRHFKLPVYITDSILPKDSLKDWKKQFQNAGISGLTWMKKWRKKKEKPPVWMSPPDHIAYLEAQVAYLQAENQAFRLIRAWKYK